MKFQAQKEHAQQTETGAKTNVNNRTEMVRRRGAVVVKLYSFTGASYYVVYKETTTTSVRLYYSAVKDNNNSFSTVFLSIAAE